MGPHEITFSVFGTPGNIDVDALRVASEALAEFLHGASQQEWVVSTLRIGSLELGARPRMLSDEEVDQEFENMVLGIGEVEFGTRMPDQWREEALTGISRMATIVGLNGVDGVGLNVGGKSIELTDDLASSAARLLQRKWKSHGSVTGVVDRFKSRRGSREFGLIEKINDRPVTVHFSKKQEHRVRGAIGKTVTAWGVLARDAEGDKRELKMEDFEVHEQKSSSPPTVDSVVGLFGEDWTGGRGSVEWVREQRRA